MAEVAGEILGITAAKSELPRRIKRLQSGQLERVVIVRHNGPVAVIVTVDEYERFRGYEHVREELEDIIEVLRAKELDDGTRVTLDEIKARFGID